MKVIFITREGYKLPGARIRCYNFARELTKYGIGTEVLSFSDTLGAKDGEEEVQMGIRDKIRYNWRALKRLAADKGAFFCIQRFNYHSFAPYLTHLLNKNRIILDLDDWEMRENPKYYFGIYPSSKAHYFTRMVAKKSSFCIAASRFLEQFLSEFNKRVYYIPSGVDTELFRPSLAGIDNKRVVFSWIGTFHRKEYVENITFALDCFNKLRTKYSNIYFDILGDGLYRNALREAVKELNDSNVILKEWVAPDAIVDYLATVHIGLLPVASRTKFNRAKSPTKLFEYMAMGKPTVSSEIGEAAHIIKNGENGLLAKTREEFTEKMQVLIQNSGLRQRIGEEARRTVEEGYSLKVLGRRLYEILNQN